MNYYTRNKQSNKIQYPVLIKYDITAPIPHQHHSTLKPIPPSTFHILQLFKSGRLPEPTHFQACLWKSIPSARVLQLFCSVAQMEQEGQVKYSSKISVESRRSQLSSCRSLERPSWSQRQHSLNKNRSLIEVMSLESSKKSDLYEKMLAEDVAPVENRKSNPIHTAFQPSSGFQPFKTTFKNSAVEAKRFSYEQSSEINHICLCYLKCKAEGCPCYEAVEEECVNELCCGECMEAKRARKARMGESRERIFCTCKKTKCNKKYCSCFAAGLKCGMECSCEDCLNCERVARMEVEPVCVVDEEIRRLEMPESMDFEPFSFRYSYNNS